MHSEDFNKLPFVTPEQQKWAQAQMAQAQQQCTGINSSLAGIPDYTPPKPSESHEKQAHYHAEEHSRNMKVVAFLRAHPEFDEFLALLRSGEITLY